MLQNNGYLAVITFKKGNKSSKVADTLTHSFRSDSKSLETSFEIEKEEHHKSPDNNRVHKKLLIENDKPVGYGQLDYLIVREIKRGNLNIVSV